MPLTVLFKLTTNCRCGIIFTESEKENEMNMKKEKDILTKTWLVALLAFISCALWGSAFSGVKTGYRLFGISADDWAGQLAFGGFRFALAGIMALIFGSIIAKKPLLPSRRSLPKIAVISFFQTILQYFCYYIGLAHTTGVKASVLVGMNVFAAIIISTLILHLEKLTSKKIIGSLVGFSGIILINLNGLINGEAFNFIGDGMILLCTIASGFSSAFMKKLSGDEDPVLLSGWQFFIGGIVLMLIGFAGGGKIGKFTVGSTSVLLYLAFVSAAAYSLWAVLLKHNPVSKVSVFGFLNPVCGVVISAVVLNETEQINASFIAAMLLVCLGIIIVNYSAERAAK